jgi:hypothetical protein
MKMGKTLLFLPAVRLVLTQRRLEKRGLSLQEFNPQQIWGSSYHTSSDKARKLYHLTKTFVQPSCDTLEEERSVCLAYGGWADRSMTHEATSWFVRYSQRELPAEPEIPEIPATFQDATGNANRKRKIRSRKRMDVGSLLGAFT